MDVNNLIILGHGSNVIKLFTFVIYNVFYKPVYLSMASLSSLAKMFVRKAAAYPNGAAKKAPFWIGSWPYPQTLH